MGPPLWAVLHLLYITGLHGKRAITIDNIYMIKEHFAVKCVFLCDLNFHVFSFII